MQSREGRTLASPSALLNLPRPSTGWGLTSSHCARIATYIANGKQHWDTLCSAASSWRHELRPEHTGYLPSAWNLCGSRPDGGKALRPAGSAVDKPVPALGLYSLRTLLALADRLHRWRGLPGGGPVTVPTR